MYVEWRYGEILLYVSECKLWSGSVDNSVNTINWMMCDLQAIAPLTDAAKRIQEVEESGKTLLEVCSNSYALLTKHEVNLPGSWPSLFFFAFLWSKTK